MSNKELIEALRDGCPHVFGDVGDPGFPDITAANYIMEQAADALSAYEWQPI